jgi:hypothetical protein
VIEAALASRDAVFDRSRLKRRIRPESPQVASAGAPRPVVPDAGDIEQDGSIPFVLTVNRVRADAPVVLGPRPVPDVHGLSVRGAATALHRAGFRVQVVRGGLSGTTVPVAGTAAPAGALVRLQFGL